MPFAQSSQINKIFYEFVLGAVMCVTLMCDMMLSNTNEPLFTATALVIVADPNEHFSGYLYSNLLH